MEIINWLRTSSGSSPSIVITKTDNTELGHDLVRAWLYQEEGDWETSRAAMPETEAGFTVFAEEFTEKVLKLNLVKLPDPTDTQAIALWQRIFKMITFKDLLEGEPYIMPEYFLNYQEFGLEEDPKNHELIYQSRTAEDDYLPWVHFEVLAPSLYDYSQSEQELVIMGSITKYYFWVDKEGDCRLGFYYTEKSPNQIDKVVGYVS